MRVVEAVQVAEAAVVEAAVVEAVPVVVWT